MEMDLPAPGFLREKAPVPGPEIRDPQAVPESDRPPAARPTGSCKGCHFALASSRAVLPAPGFYAEMTAL